MNHQSINQMNDNINQSVGKGMATNLDFAKQMQARTKTFAIRIIRMFQSLPKTEEARIVGRQVLKSGTSVAANYRAVCRAKSRADFVSKMATVVEETDETLFWIELLEEAGIVAAKKLESIKAETTELLRIFSRSLDTARRRR
jgi:four helix bundle protein